LQRDVYASVADPHHFHATLAPGMTPTQQYIGTHVKGWSHEILVSLFLISFDIYEVRNRAGSGLFFNLRLRKRS
jgi:hypothetical protein